MSIKLLLLLLLLKFASITKKVLLHACRIYLLNSHTYPCNDDNTQGRWPKPSEEGGGGGEGNTQMKGGGGGGPPPPPPPPPQSKIDQKSPVWIGLNSNWVIISVELIVRPAHT